MDILTCDYARNKPRLFLIDLLLGEWRMKNAKPLVYYLSLGSFSYFCFILFFFNNKTSVCLKLTVGLLSYLIKRKEKEKE